MLELKRITTNKKTINNCTIESVTCDTVNVKTVKQERTFKKQYLKSVFGLDSHYINVVHYNGRKKRIDIYALAFYCTFKTLRKATTKRAIELFDNKYSYCAHDWQDMICTGVDYCLYGYVDGNGKYHKGYYTDKISTVKELTGVIYSAINSVIYAKGVTGKWTGVEVLTDDFAIVKDVTNIFGYVASGKKTVNTEKYNQFINDIRKNIKTKYVAIFDFVIDRDYINVNGTVQSNLVAELLGVSDRTVRRALADVKTSAKNVVSNYNMTVEQFIEYLEIA